MAWRARSHYLTRSPVFLLRTTLIILASGLCAALLLVMVTSGEKVGNSSDLIKALIDPAGEQLREGAQKLQSSPEPQPRKLARWLRRACMREQAEADEAQPPKTALSRFMLAGQDVAAMLEKHVTDSSTRVLFEAYITCALATDVPATDAAAARLKTAAEQPEPPAFANQLWGQLLVQDERSGPALAAFMIEGTRFPDAKPARAEALHWAVHLKDIPSIKEMLAIPGWKSDAEPSLVYHAAGLAGDVWLQWQMLVQLRIRDMPLAKLGLTLFAIGIWYVILVQISGFTQRWRWTLPLLPLIAGVASIWPTLSLVTFQEQHLGLSEDAPFPHNLWYFFGGIGLREELCKLALFVPFLPWLLKKKNPGLALITGGFVGLGFALEENINYYDSTGGSVVWGRFITANFMHLALTGIAAHGLYLTVRSGFTRLSDFIGAFVGVVAAHGLYDMVIIMDGSDQIGLGAFSIIVLFFISRHFFTLVDHETPANRGAISPLAVFFLGSAILVAALFVVAGWVGGTTQAIAEVGKGCLGIVPVGFMFWKHLH